MQIVKTPVTEAEVEKQAPAKRAGGKVSEFRAYFDGNWYPVKLGKDDNAKQISSRIRTAAANAKMSCSIRMSEDGKVLFFKAAPKS